MKKFPDIDHDPSMASGPVHAHRKRLHPEKAATG